MVASDRDRRAADDRVRPGAAVELLIQRLPAAFQPRVRWLRRPSARWVRIAAGIC